MLISLVLLEHFDSLDSDDNDALDYLEFTVYSGDTPSAQAIFRLMDSDTDQSISYQEILNTIQMMEVQTTEGTGNDTYNEGDVPSTQPQPEIVATSTTPATQVTQEISSEDDVKNEREALDTLTGRNTYMNEHVYIVMCIIFLITLLDTLENVLISHL